ncbi:zinc finger and BTB domain-containing protein 24 isoform X1 [Oncorhynchus mykiss]|uniref:zinc finger and BTB domain-containing protein 24 isoform X1 n=2 Tax=Oncorhynchus mykiss TaxID=8022 RepID=UPI00187891A5|nr:zinc finger and BTB domain-containing protein 24 isoform X1 [Oncorhynchus mykiss]
MEIHKCIVRGCANQSDAIIHYSLPEEPQRRQRWLQFINGSNPGEQIPDVSRLCGDHFAEECFTELDLGFTTRLILNLDAIPSIYSSDKTSAYRKHTVYTERAKGTGMVEGKMAGIKEEPVDRELDSQVNRWNNLLGSLSKSFSSIKKEDVGEDESSAESYDQIRVVKIGDSHTGERKDDGGEYGMEYSHTHPYEGEDGGYDAMVTDLHRKEKMNVTAREVEGVFVIENSNPEEECREYVVGEEVWQMEERGESRTVEMWGEKGKRRKLPGPQWWRYEQERRKTQEDEWKMIAERAREEERERQKGRTVEGKKRVAGFRCPQCCKTFQYRSELLEHKTSCCTNAKYACPVPLCPQIYQSKASLTNHVCFHHVKEDNKEEKDLDAIRKARGVGEHQNKYQPSHKKFFCPLCKTYYRNQIVLDKHSRSHTSLHKVMLCCSFCSVEMLNKCTMKKHYNTEHPGRVPRCEMCERNFSSIDIFLTHQFRHVAVTPYYCYECHIYQLTQRGLTVHLKNHALRRNQKQLDQQSGKINKPDNTGNHSTAPLKKSPSPLPNNHAHLQDNHAHLQEIKEEFMTK